MMSKCMLTTKDNPYDPLEDFNNWYMYDMTAGYNTCAYLARIAHTSDGLSDTENEEEIERAIDEIIQFDFLDLYRKVTDKDISSEES